MTDSTTVDDLSSVIVQQQWIPMEPSLFRTYQQLHLAALQTLDERLTTPHDGNTTIDYWICGGTLLGAMRHGGFVPHDDDLDIECHDDDLERLAAALVPTNNDDYNYLGLERGGQWRGYPVYKMRFRGDVAIDVFPRKKNTLSPEEEGSDDDKRSAKTNKKYFPTRHEVFPLQRYTFENISVWGPGGDATSYLKRLYGDDCFETVLVWNHDFNNFHSKAFDERRTVVPLERYKDMIQAAGIEPPRAKSTAAETYQAAFAQFEGGEEEFTKQLQAYKRQRTFRWNRADAEWRDRQRQQQQKELREMGY